MVVRWVFGGIEEGHDRLLAHNVQYHPYAVWCLFQLIPVTLRKILEFVRIVPEPGAELGRWGDYLKPGSNASFLLSDSAGPQSVNGYPVTIASFYRFIHTLDLQHRLNKVIEQGKTEGECPEC